MEMAASISFGVTKLASRKRAPPAKIQASPRISLLERQRGAYVFRGAYTHWPCEVVEALFKALARATFPARCATAPATTLAKVLGQADDAARAIAGSHEQAYQTRDNAEPQASSSAAVGPLKTRSSSEAVAHQGPAQAAKR